jgi:hypothetical protein
VHPNKQDLKRVVQRYGKGLIGFKIEIIRQFLAILSHMELKKYFVLAFVEFTRK